MRRVPLAAATAALVVLAGAGHAADEPTLTVPTYVARTLPFVDGAEPFRVALGDLNGDGRIDIAVCGTTLERGSVRIFLAQPNGDYAIQDLEVPPSPRGIAIADLDGDGHLDLVTANNRGASVSIFPGDGRGGFGGRKDLPFRGNPFAIVADDADGDGRMDLVAVGEAGLVGILYGRGRFEFDPWVLYNQPYGTSDVIALDVDGDGRRDFVIPNWREGTVLTLWNRGKGHVYPGLLAPYDGTGAFGVAGGDFDGDGRADVAVSILDGSLVAVLLGNGDGSFRRGSRLHVGSGVRDVIRAHLNEDVPVDLVAVSTDVDQATLFYGDGKGGFVTTEPLATGKHPRSAAAGDLNGDGLDDIVVANLASHDVTVFLSQADRRVATRPASIDPKEALRPLGELADVHRQAEAAFGAGDMVAALAGFERVIAAGEPLLRSGALAPPASTPEWLRYLGAVAMVSDIRRYHQHDPAGAAAAERRLARLAERRHCFSIAGVAWMSVAEIGRDELRDPAAAEWAYERIARLARAEALAAPGAAVYPPTAMQALHALDTLHASDTGYSRRLRGVHLPLVFEIEKSDITNVVAPHVSAYGSAPDGKPGVLYAEFARAHSASFRAAYAGYFDYASAVLFGRVFGQGAEPDTLHDAFFDRYPDEPLGLEVVSLAMRYHQGHHHEEEYQREVEVARKLGDRLGVAVDVAGANLPTSR